MFSFISNLFIPCCCYPEPEQQEAQPLLICGEAGRQTYEVLSQDPVLYRIFFHLSPKNVCNVALVCKKWRKIASMDALWQSFRLQELFPKATIIDREFWEKYVDLGKYGLVFEQNQRPCVRSKEEFVELRKMESRVKLGISFLTLPKNLSILAMVKMGNALKQGNSIFVGVQKVMLEFFNATEQDYWGMGKIEKTFTVAITNGNLKNTAFRSIRTKMDKIAQVKGELCPVLTLLALAILKFADSDPSSPIQLFYKTSTFCSETNAQGEHSCIAYSYDNEGLIVEKGFLVDVFWGGVACMRVLQNADH